jgi:hypothetical protein
VHIIENYNKYVNKTYCYASECIWDKHLKKYIKPRTSVGRLEGSPLVFVPNKAFLQLLMADNIDPSATDAQAKKVIDAVKAKYGDIAYPQVTPAIKPVARTAYAVFSGPSIVFGGIAARYRINA